MHIWETKVPVKMKQMESKFLLCIVLQLYPTSLLESVQYLNFRFGFKLTDLNKGTPITADQKRILIFFIFLTNIINRAEPTKIGHICRR